MTRAMYTFALLSALLGGCAKEPVPPTGWATTVTRVSGTVEPSCNKKHATSEPTSGTAPALARYASKLLDENGALKADLERCGAWARGQR